MSQIHFTKPVRLKSIGIDEEGTIDGITNVDREKAIAYTMKSLDSVEDQMSKTRDFKTLHELQEEANTIAEGINNFLEDKEPIDMHSILNSLSDILNKILELVDKLPTEQEPEEEVYPDTEEYPSKKGKLQKCYDGYTLDFDY